MVQALSAGCGVARGLSYFHREKKQDVKSEYIILITNNCRLTSNLTLTIFALAAQGVRVSQMCLTVTPYSVHSTKRSKALVHVRLAAHWFNGVAHVSQHSHSFIMTHYKAVALL